MTPSGSRSLLVDRFCLTGEVVWSSRFTSHADLRLPIAAQAFAGKLDRMNMVNEAIEAIEEVVGAGGIAKDFTPMIRREPGSLDRRAGARSRFENFEEI
jgi:hypothetical protein